MPDTACKASTAALKRLSDASVGDTGGNSRPFALVDFNLRGLGGGFVDAFG